MISQEQLEQILANPESYRAELTTSTSDMDKFCQAICAFANDLPGDGKRLSVFVFFFFTLIPRLHGPVKADDPGPDFRLLAARGAGIIVLSGHGINVSRH